MAFHLGGKGLHHLTGGVEVSIAQDVEQMIIAELHILTVLCLIQSVGIDKQRTTLDVIYFLALKLLSRHDADGEVR